MTTLRYALRLLRRSPGFTLVAVLTLAIGIAANTVLFSAIEALLLRRLPYPAADRLYVPTPTVSRGGKQEPILYWSYPKYRTLLETQDLFEEVGAFGDSELNLTGLGPPQRLLAEMVTASYFPLLGITAARGRTFAAEDDRPGGPPVAVVGHDVWQRAFGGDATLVGRTLRLNGKPVTVVGIAPPGFRGLTGTAEVWVPIAMAAQTIHPKILEMPRAHWFMAVGRLKPGASLAGMERIGAVVEAAHPSPSKADHWGATAIRLDEARSDPKLRTAVLVLFGAVALVLLIGCVNVAHLTLSRGAARRQELAVRLAMGATRARLVGQLVVESILLALISGVVALFLAMWGFEILASLRPASVSGLGLGTRQLQDLAGAGLGGPVLLFTLLVSLFAGGLFGLLPALRATRVDLHLELKESGSGITPRLPARGFLAATEIAFALVLLVGAGLLLQSLGRVTAIDPGVRVDGVLTFSVDRARRMDGSPENLQFHEQLQERLAAVPGIESVAVANCAPMAGGCDMTIVYQIEGRPKFTEGSEPEIGVHFVGTDYFRTLGIRLSRGRLFTRADRKGAPQVIVINETAARRLLPGEDPIGKRIHAGYGAEQDMSEIVGVVSDVRYDGPEMAVKPALYVPALQQAPEAIMVFARAAGEPTALVGPIRDAMKSLDPDVPLYSIRTLEERTRDATARARFAAVLLCGFAGIALLLAGLGVYGVMASHVAGRRREIGIRMALGADVGNVLAMLVGHGALITAIGLAVGLGGALAVSHILSSLLFHVSPHDPMTYVGVTALLGAVAMVTCTLAARRATKVEPLEALRRS